MQTKHPDNIPALGRRDGGSRLEQQAPLHFSERPETPQAPQTPPGQFWRSPTGPTSSHRRWDGRWLLGSDTGSVQGRIWTLLLFLKSPHQPWPFPAAEAEAAKLKLDKEMGAAAPWGQPRAPRQPHGELPAKERAGTGPGALSLPGGTTSDGVSAQSCSQVGSGMGPGRAVGTAGSEQQGHGGDRPGELGPRRQPQGVQLQAGRGLLGEVCSGGTPSQLCPGQALPVEGKTQPPTWPGAEAEGWQQGQRGSQLGPSRHRALSRKWGWKESRGAGVAAARPAGSPRGPTSACRTAAGGRWRGRSLLPP